MAKAKRGKKKSGRPGASTAASHPVERRRDVAIVGLALIGMAITAYLTLAAWTRSTPAFCQEGGGCDLIQQSQWSSFLGLPIALWGFGLYAVLAVIAVAMPPRLKSWRRLWLVAFVGVSVSVYLTAVGWFTLEAFCGWCLASLATIAAILAVVFLRRPGSAPGMPWSHWLLRSGAAGLVVVAVLHVVASDLLSRPGDPRLAALAIHLEESGARYYGASWCPACRQQSRLFGAASERLPYVECSPGGRGTPMARVCANAGVASYPTWIIYGRRYEEVLRPRELAELSGFHWEGGSR